MVGESETSVPPVEKKRLSRSRRQVYLQVVAATVILACGIVIGSGAALLYFKDDIVPNRLPPPGDIVRDMRSRYGLTEEQTKKAEAALGASRERMHTVFEGMREKMDAEFQELSSAMRGILTPEQFELWKNDFKSRRGRGPDRFGPGKGGPGSGGPGPGAFGPGRGGPGGGRSGSGRRGPGGPEGGRFDQGRHERPGPNSPPQ